jgi:hydrogenase maturation protein HypF
VQRYVIRIEGIVQGVGFRPFVYHVASRLGLGGFVRNQTGAVWIEVEGSPKALDQFIEELKHPPSLAQIDRLTCELRPLQHQRGFRIESSALESSQHVFLPPDTATCIDCLNEIFDPESRRFDYPFTNCTRCGPRLTIITEAPYDRVRTTMAAFEMCLACREEYDNPVDRRFHAQPIACPACGPQLQLLDASGNPVDHRHPLDAFAERIRDGQIGAIKGLGGYHLVCLATDDRAVARLRRRKARDEKPFAIMVADPQAAAELCDFDSIERELLTSPRAPIVLLAKRIPCPIAASVVPRHPWLGVMLAYTPLHHLLLRRLGGAALVMTSGNRSDEPIAYQDDDAVQRLRGIADVFLKHDRAIHVRCDDSVTSVVSGVELLIRRSRGYAPQPIRMAANCPRLTLAVGGQLKGTFALARDDQAFVSHHLGDLDDFRAYRSFQQDVALYEQLFALRPQRIAHDLHPDYASTRYAIQRGQREGMELIAVQHHHAHLASCMADNSLDPHIPVIGVTFDGAGLGTDGAIWGGEFLLGDCRQFCRVAHLRYISMPGGEQAIREPWRMAAAHLFDAGALVDSSLLDANCGVSRLKSQVAPLSWRTIQTMLRRHLNCPQTSSMGRLFDAVAALAGIRCHAGYEGQAASELEWLAMAVDPDRDPTYPFEVVASPPAAAQQSTAPQPAVRAATISDVSGEWPLIIDTRKLITAVVQDVTSGAVPARVARRFHTTVVAMIVDICGRIRETTGVEQVVLTGGVFSNRLLMIEAIKGLEAQRFAVYRHRQVSPGDGGLSLGQLAVAATRCENGKLHGPLLLAAASPEC